MERYTIVPPEPVSVLEQLPLDNRKGLFHNCGEKKKQANWGLIIISQYKQSLAKRSDSDGRINNKHKVRLNYKTN